MLMMPLFAAKGFFAVPVKTLPRPESDGENPFAD